MSGRPEIHCDVAGFAPARALGRRSVRSGGGGESHREAWPRSILSMSRDGMASSVDAQAQAMPGCRVSGADERRKRRRSPSHRGQKRF